MCLSKIRTIIRTSLMPLSAMPAGRMNDSNCYFPSVAMMVSYLECTTLQQLTSSGDLGPCAVVSRTRKTGPRLERGVYPVVSIGLGEKDRQKLRLATTAISLHSAFPSLYLTRPKEPNHPNHLFSASISPTHILFIITHEHYPPHL